MALARFTAPNPTLEELRESALRRRNTDIDTQDLQTLTSRIHVGFFFTQEGEEALRILCSYVGSVEEGSPSPDWQEFADYLCISRVQMKNIRNHFQAAEGPVVCVMAVYAQLDDSTIAKVIHALHQMGRHDVIDQINDEIRKLVRLVRMAAPNVEDEELAILRPPSIPYVALVLRPPRSELNQGVQRVMIVERNGLNAFRGDGSMIHNAPFEPLFFRVMLTFAEDGREAAERIKILFRSHNPKIGVLILAEQLSSLFADETGFVNDCLRQVDAIVPILTKGYMDIINGRPIHEAESSFFKRDQKFVKYIHNSIRDEFVHNGCINARVGCIIPDNQDYRLPLLPSELRIRFLESEATEFMNLLLKAKLRRRKMRQ